MRQCDDKLYYLLLRAYEYWDFPKGMVEEGEAPLVAAEREVEEETTLVGLSFQWGFDYYETAPYGKFQKTARYYLAETRTEAIDLPVSEELGHPEHEEFRWLEYDDAIIIVSPRVKAVMAWARRILDG